MEISYKELLSNPSMVCLVLARTLDPIATTSIFSYMYAQLKWMSPNASDVEISTQAGLLIASKTAAKVLTNLLWGRLSDKPYGGRRMVLLVSLFASCIATAGYGFATSFPVAVFWQIMNGAMSSSIGIIRCIVSELETRPTHRSRALLLLPLAGSVGQFVGPVLGGVLTTFSKVGDGSFLGRFPFALPNLVLASMYCISFVGSAYTVEETLEGFDKSKGSGFWQCWLKICNITRRKGADNHAYAPLATDDQSRDDYTVESPTIEEHSHEEIREAKTLTFWQIWTPQVICTLIAHFLGHITTFGATWSIFLASPVDDGTFAPPLKFTGGLDLTPAKIGTLASIFALVAIALQTSLPKLNDRYGIIGVWRTALCFFPFAYVAAPFTTVIASQLGGIYKWAALSVVYIVFAIGRVGAQPMMALLIDNAVPAPSARGTINVAGTVVGNLSRSIIPVALMALYGWGYKNNVVWVGFWAMAALSILSIVASGWVRLKGNEITADQRNDLQDDVEGGESRHALAGR